MNAVSKSSAYPATVQPGIPRLSECPDGWRRTCLGDLLHEERRPVKMDDDQVYRLLTVKRGRGGVVEREHLSGKEISVKSQFEVNSGDFLISKRQIVHGACGIVPRALAGSIVSNEYSVLRGNKEIDMDFLKYLSHSTYFQQTCFHSSIGVHIEKMIFKLDRWLKWEFDLPPLPEQQKIAEILTTWDRAIEAFEKLIANSQAQKKALMQRLLEVDPQNLNEKDEEWEVISLGDLGEFFSGVTYSPEDISDDDGLLVLRSSNVQSNQIVLDDNVMVREDVPHSTLTKAGDIIICVRNGSRSLIGKSAQIGPNHQGLAHGAFMSLYRSHEPKIADQLLKTERFKRQVKRNLGATINSINTSDMRRFSFAVPCGKNKQLIFSVLGSCDAELENLRHDLSRLREEKAALMQQLLTGKRRVKVMEEAA